MKKVAYSYSCPECGLRITSVNKGQFEWNRGQHILRHKLQHERKKEIQKQKEVNENDNV